MIKIGITGSLSSGKTTASKILSRRRGPLFSADNIVKRLYKSPKFKNLISRKFSIKNSNDIKKSLKKLILDNKINIKKLEKIIHPEVRNEMKKFTSKNKKQKMLFYEIPLLIESRLMKFFDVIIFIKCNKKKRLKRFISKKGSKKLFNLLNVKQISDNKKIKFCDHIVVNEKNFYILKNNLSTIIKNYE